MEENYNVIKVIATAVGTFFTAMLSTLLVPMMVLATLNITDYFTGLAAAPNRGEKRESSKGINGIAKKICMWLLVGIGAAMDWLVSYATEAVGIQIELKFALAAAVAIWIICNEIISILENIGDIGVPLPNFLMRMVLWVKKSTEDKANIVGGTDDKIYGTDKIMKGDK